MTRYGGIKTGYYLSKLLSCCLYRKGTFDPCWYVGCTSINDKE
jgi:hypothetical protein